MPRDDPGRWLIREPTADIFDRQSIVISETAGSDTFARQPFQVILVMYSFLETTAESSAYSTVGFWVLTIWQNGKKICCS